METYSDLFKRGEENVNYARFFTGTSYLKDFYADSERGFGVHNVTFEPGCRNNWHIHRAASGGGQLLLCVAGEGIYQEWGKHAVRLEPGSVVLIKPDVKHWHGAVKDNWFSHIAIELPGENCCPEWLEPVSDEDYLKADCSAAGA